MIKEIEEAPINYVNFSSRQSPFDVNLCKLFIRLKLNIRLIFLHY
jgi:hypothetical protein